MNCKTLFNGSLSLLNIRKMTNQVRRVLVSFLFDNRSALSIPAGFFTCFFRSDGFINPVDLYNVVKACNIWSAVIVKQYNQERTYHISIVQRFAADVF